MAVITQQGASPRDPSGRTASDNKASRRSVSSAGRDRRSARGSGVPRGPSDAVLTAPTPARPLLPLWLAVFTAAAGGALIDAGSPDKLWWPVGFVGIGLVLWALIGHRPGRAFVLGLIAGFSFWGVHIFWLTLYLGPVPWLALAGLQTIFFGVGAMLIAVVYRLAPTVWPTRLGRLGLVPVIISGLWGLRESISAVWPEGGFSWGKVAFTQSESPLAPLVAWVGFTGLSFIMVWLVAFAIQLVRETTMPALRRLLLVTTAVVAILAMPAWPAPTEGTSRIAAVQGNSDAGLFSARAFGDILNDHISETLPLVGEKVDMVVWPENASDIDPTRYPQAARALDYLSREMDAPFVVGTITQTDAGEYYNSSLLWEAGQGATDIYDKRHPVPFAEYMPARPLFRALVPDLVDLVTRDYGKGTTDTVFDINGVIAGISICFDITDDSVVREMMGQGAQVILAQTNNADFGRTNENLQQLSIARLRAIETGRSLVNISTVGNSAIIGPDGKTITAIAPYQAGSMIADVPLATVNTPATLFGAGIELLIGGLGLAGLAIAVAFRSRTTMAKKKRPARS
jgi:apolipoprotein N-acyltransferase